MRSQSMSDFKGNVGAVVPEIVQLKSDYDRGMISYREFQARREGAVQKLQQRNPNMFDLRSRLYAQDSDVQLDTRALRMGSQAQNFQLESLLRQRNNLEMTAQSTSDPRVRKRAQEALNFNRERIDELQSDMSYDPSEDARNAGRDFAENVMNSFTDSIKAFAKGEKSFKDMLKDMWANYTANVVDTMFKGLMAKSPIGKLLGAHGEALHGIWNRENKDTNALTSLKVAMGGPRPDDPRSAPGFMDALGFGEGGAFSGVIEKIRSFFGLETGKDTSISEGALGSLGMTGFYSFTNPMPVAIVAGGVSGEGGGGGLFGGLLGGLKSDGETSDTMGLGTSFKEGLFGGAGYGVPNETLSLGAGLMGGPSVFGASDTMKTGFGDVVDSISESTKTQGGFFESLGGIFSGGLEGLGGLFSKGLQGLGSLFGGGGGGGGASGIWGMIGSFIGSMFADGGYVSGPGTSRSDSIPAMLSNGEFVVNAAATRQWLPLLSSINYGQTPKFADGGLVGSSNPVYMPIPMQPNNHTVNNSRSSQVFNINVTGDVSRQTRSEIQRMLPAIAYGVNQHNRENN